MRSPVVALHESGGVDFSPVHPVGGHSHPSAASGRFVAEDVVGLEAKDLALLG